MPSQAQTITTVVLFDYEIANGVALTSQRVSCQLVAPINAATPQAVPTVASSPTAQVPAEAVTLFTTTDGNGYWQFTVPANNIITPANSYYVVETPFRSMKVAIPSGAGPFQASANLAS